MLLIGGYELDPHPSDYRLIADGFRRLPAEVGGASDVIRFIGFDSFLKGESHVRFFGMEVAEMHKIPEGMVAWELGDSRWTLWKPESDVDGDPVVAWQEDIDWIWLNPPPGSGKNNVGEFTAQGPAEWSRSDLRTRREFWMFAHSISELIGRDSRTIYTYVITIFRGPSDLPRWSDGCAGKWVRRSRSE